MSEGLFVQVCQGERLLKKETRGFGNGDLNEHLRINSESPFEGEVRGIWKGRLWFL